MFLFTAILFLAPLFGMTDSAHAGLGAQVRRTTRELRRAQVAERHASNAFRQAVADHEMGLAALHGRVVQARRHVRRVKTRLAELRQRLSLQRASQRQDWWPLVRHVAAGEHVSARGLYKLMWLESGRRADARAGQFYGLFMYCPSTWRAAWNPWRDRSILDGEAQIRATARAIRRGWGPHMWPNTYPMAF